jgi:YVTN family beta-propeller protein
MNKRGKLKIRNMNYNWAMKKSMWMLLFAVLLITSCKKEETEEEEETLSYAQGIFFVNEGSFGNNNASIDWIYGSNRENDVFFEVNGVGLGDVLQDLVFANGYGFAVMNNSQKVVQFSQSDFKFIREIEGLSYPRHMIVASDGFGYVTNGSGDGTVEKIDISTGQIVGSVAVGNGPEMLAEAQGRLVVCNSGGWGSDNSVTVIDLATFQEVTTVFVGDRPVDLVVDAMENVWIMCAGQIFYDANWNVTGHTEARLITLNPITLSTLNNFVIGEEGDHPTQLEVSPDGNTVYFANNGVFALDVNEETPVEIIQESGYGLTVRSSNGEIWVAGPANFVSNSTVYRYSPSGAAISTYTGGIGTREILFEE